MFAERGVPNSVGIAYEVPAVTSFVGLRALGKPVNRVGVVYRKALAHYVSAQQGLAQGVRVPVRPGAWGEPHQADDESGRLFGLLDRRDIDVADDPRGFGRKTA